jgi:hypothetical protein
MAFQHLNPQDATKSPENVLMLLRSFTDLFRLSSLSVWPFTLEPSIAFKPRLYGMVTNCFTSPSFLENVLMLLRPLTGLFRLSFLSGRLVLSSLDYIEIVTNCFTGNTCKGTK